MHDLQLHSSPRRTSLDESTTPLIHSSDDQASSQEKGSGSAEPKNMKVKAKMAAVAQNLMGYVWSVCNVFLLVLILASWQYDSWLSFALILFTAPGYLYYLQDLLVYQPSHENSRYFLRSPARYGLPHESVQIKTVDGCTLQCFLFLQPQSKRGKAFTILHCHGNAGNIGGRIEDALQWYRYAGCNVLLLEYRGYGFSTGTPSEHGLYRDAEAGLEYLMSRRDINPGRLVVFGRSLGGAVAVQLATSPAHEQHIAACILENTFTCIQHMGIQMFNFKYLKYIPEACVKNKFPTQSRIHKLSVPTLFLSGKDDTLVPPSMMERLFQHCGSREKQIARFPDGGHNDTWTCDGYVQALTSFLAQVYTKSTVESFPDCV